MSEVEEKEILEAFKEEFEGDFSFSEEAISDKKIIQALKKAHLRLHPCLVGTKDYLLAWLNLGAFFLFEKYQSGFEGDCPEKRSLGFTASLSNGSFSKSFAIPERFLKSPFWSYYASNPYGLEYLFLVYPCSIGHVYIGEGASTV